MMRKYSNINTITHNILVLQLIFSLFATHRIQMAWLLFFLIELCCVMFLEVQSYSLEVLPFLQVYLLKCYILFSTRFLWHCPYHCCCIITKFEFIFIRWYEMTSYYSCRSYSMVNQLLFMSLAFNGWLLDYWASFWCLCLCLVWVLVFATFFSSETLSWMYQSYFWLRVALVLLSRGHYHILRIFVGFFK